MDRKSTYNHRKVDTQGRISFPMEWEREWEAGQEMILCPLIYIRRIKLPNHLEMQAWTLQSRDRIDELHWEISPNMILNVENDIDAKDLAECIDFPKLQKHKDDILDK